MGRLLMLFPLLALAACGFEDAQLDMNVPQIPARFAQDQTGLAAHQTEERGKISQDWPKLFGSAELTRLSQQAVSGNFDIAAAAARLIQAQGQAMISSAALIPSLSGTGSASRSYTPGTLRSRTAPFEASVGNNFNLGLSASYVLDFWGRNRALADAANWNEMATAYDRATLIVSTQATLTNTYFQVLVAQDRLRLARQNVEIAEHVLSAIKARMDVGTATALDLAQQESIVASQRASIPALEQSQQQASVLVASLVGRTPQSVVITGGSLERMNVPKVQPGLPSQLLLRRPDLAAAEARLKAANGNIKAARTALLPSISLSTQSGLGSSTLANLLRPDALAASLAAGLVQPIFNGDQPEGQLRQAQGRQIELLADYRKVIVTALADVENALIAVRLTSEHEDLQARVVASARRAYEITEQRLQEGTIDVVTLLNTQLTLFQAQDNLTLIRYQRLQALVSLFQALGGGFTRDMRDEVL
ncbi:MAG: efflux transporter outer membrane subunit [Alphaproteobacteria bacterium]|nr:efflux transporter outer membrane subunit [Alphaproteobacteria bacterium]